LVSHFCSVGREKADASSDGRFGFGTKTYPNKYDIGRASTTRAKKGKGFGGGPGSPTTQGALRGVKMGKNGGLTKTDLETNGQGCVRATNKGDGRGRKREVAKDIWG